MKHLLIAVLSLSLVGQSFAQKEAPKPNVNKALSLARQGKFAEAKAIVDGVPTHEKTMADDKSWFYRGIIYVAMDTSSAFSGEGNNVAVGAQAFEKAVELAGPKGKLVIVDPVSGEQKALDQLIAEFNYAFLIKGDKLFSSDKFKEAVVQFEKGLTLKPDTAIFRYAAYAAHNGGDVDQAIDYVGRYIKNGGTNSQAIYLRVASLYEYKKDFQAALNAAREYLISNPNDANVRQIEFNCLIELKMFQEAAANLKENLKAKPNDAEALYLLGALYEELKDPAASRGYFEKAIEVDPTHLKSALAIARYGNIRFQEVKQEMDKLDFKKDSKKLMELDKVYLQKLRDAVALWENCEKISPNDREILSNLWRIYSPSQLDDKAKFARVEQQMKVNGFLD